MNPKFQHRSLAELVRETLEGADGLQALLSLELENQSLKEIFLRDPSMAITGELFELAEPLIQHACALAEAFAIRQEIRLEEKALQLRVECVRTAYAHRRNVVGPALLDWANCNKRIGDLEKSDEIFDSLIRDLSTVLPWGPSFDPDWLLTIDCLQQALLATGQNYGDLQEKTEKMLMDSRLLVHQVSEKNK